MSLSVNRIVNVTMSISPKAAQQRGFGTLCILGDTPNILQEGELFKSYSDAASVADDFGVDSPEATASQAYFAQSPQPQNLIVTTWNNAPSAGVITGGDIGGDLEPFKHADAEFKIDIDGSERTITADLSSITNLDDLVNALKTPLSAYADIVKAGNAVMLTSKTKGKASTFGFAKKGSGTDISALLALTEAKGAIIVNGKDDAETIAECLNRILSDFGRSFYGLVLATKETVSDDQIVEVAQIIESAKNSHIFAVTTSDKSLLNTTYTNDTSDLFSKLKRGKYSRTIAFYADYKEGDNAYKLNKYFGASALGRMFTVNFNGSNTTLTLKFKQAPTLQPTNLSESQATNLQSRNINIYGIYDNDTYIIEEGVMCDGIFADERHGLDWLQDAVQNEIYNVLYQSKKIPQTDDGIERIKARIASVLELAVNNGLVAPGQWNSDGFGALADGDYLPNGFYIYSDSVNNQLQSQRESREAPPIQVAIKLAGAIHSVDILVNVNR